MDIGARIKLARQRAGLSQTELAHRTGVTRGLVGQWETQRKQPGRNNLLRIAQATSVSVGFLLGEKVHSADLAQPSTPDELALVMLYRRLNIHERRNLANLLAKYSGISARQLHAGLIRGRHTNIINRYLRPHVCCANVQQPTQMPRKPVRGKLVRRPLQRR